MVLQNGSTITVAQPGELFLGQAATHRFFGLRKEVTGLAKELQQLLLIFAKMRQWNTQLKDLQLLVYTVHIL